jgi:dUTP pyrophosphatase
MIETLEGERFTTDDYLSEASAELRHASDVFVKLQRTMPALHVAVGDGHVNVTESLLAVCKHLGNAVQHVVASQVTAQDRVPERIRIHLQKGATLTRNRTSDVGHDLRALLACERVVPARGSWVVRTGVHVELPDDVEAMICPRSGLSKHHGVVPDIGVVDPGYRGELEVVLRNHTDHDYPLLPGERVAQLVFRRVLLPEFEYVDLDVLAPSERGMLGHGSSGRL